MQERISKKEIKFGHVQEKCVKTVESKHFKRRYTNFLFMWDDKVESLSIIYMIIN